MKTNFDNMDNLTSNHLKKIELSLPSEYYFDENFIYKELKKFGLKIGFMFAILAD